MPSITVSSRDALAARYAALMSESDAQPFHGDCANPVHIELVGREAPHQYAQREQWDEAEGYGPIAPHLQGRTASNPHMVLAWRTVRCRKCEPCRKWRRRRWTAKAICESIWSNRTWFVTLTLRPEERFKAEMRAAHKVGNDWASLDDRERFTAIVKAIYPDVQKWLKRVRKQSGARLRYLLVAEAHQDGFPHLHLLLHEQEGKVRERDLEHQWKLGVSHGRLTSGEKAGYVCKYLAKQVWTRPYASLRYGQPPKAGLSQLPRPEGSAVRAMDTERTAWPVSREGAKRGSKEAKRSGASKRIRNKALL